MYNPQPYRVLFSHIGNGITYLNHAAISPLSTAVADSLMTYMDGRSADSIDNFEQMAGVLRAVKEKIARMINTREDRIAFVDNTSNGLNLLANGLKWIPGDRVLLNTMEFPSNVYPFMNLHKHGVEVDFVDHRDNMIPVERLITAVTPRTRLISISHVQYMNGFCSDLEAIGSFCRDRNIIFSVDAIQSAGAVPIDVEKMKIDFLATGSHKWLMAPEGIGFIFVTEEIQSRIEQAYVGWTSVSNYFERMREFRLDLDPTARRYENGMLNSAGIIGLGASLDILMKVGIGIIREHILDLTDFFIRSLKERGIECCTPENRDERSGIVSFKPADSTSLLEVLKKRRVHTAVRGGNVRMSPHFYNTTEEIETLVDCIDESQKKS